jgi:hypothetical protein
MNFLPAEQPKRNDPHFGLTADLDADGDVDLVIRTEWGPFQSRMWLNDGTGRFTAGQLMWATTAVAVADLTGDGRPDLIAAAHGLVNLHLGNGDGTFVPTSFQVSVGLAALRDRLEILDWNGDGRPDLLGGWWSNNRVALLTNQGGLAFTSTSGPEPLGRGSDLRVFVADINGDGLRDLLVHPAEWTRDGTLVRLRLPGPGWNFAPGIVQMMTPQALADLDGDGDLEAIEIDAAHRNYTFDGPLAGARRQYGVGSAGSGGFVPTIGAAGPFRSGHAAETRVTGALGGTIGFYLFGATEAALPDAPLPGMSLYVLPAWVLVALVGQGPHGQPGEGWFSVPYVVDASLAGATIYKQMFVLDPGAPYGISATNGVAVTYGR